MKNDAGGELQLEHTLTARATRELKRAVARVAPAARTTMPSFERVLVRISPVDPLRWVASQDDGVRFFWRGRAQQDAVAGIGVAAKVQGENRGPIDFADLRSRIRGHLHMSPPAVRFFGGLRFDPESASSDEWSSFPSFRFHVPLFEVRRLQSECFLICNVSPTADRDWLIDRIERLRPPVPAWPSLPSLVRRFDNPDDREWTHGVEWALRAFSSTALAKVVLARVAHFDFDGALDAYGLMARLRATTPHCYHFVFENDGDAFLGASPERLFSRNGNDIRSEAVAGTRPRGLTTGDDQQLRDELLLSEKDQREHEYVRQSVKEALTDITRVLHVDTTASEMRLARGRHLVSHVDGVLKDGVDTFDLIDALHPTPAVGGYPYLEAADVIRHLEPFDRGWYAGPVGWIGNDTAEFAVGIRSGLVRGPLLRLYSGAGIVCGSDPVREWNEVEQKIGDFVRALHVDNGR